MNDNRSGWTSPVSSAMLLFNGVPTAGIVLVDWPESGALNQNELISRRRSVLFAYRKFGFD